MVHRLLPLLLAVAALAALPGGVGAAPSRDATTASCQPRNLRVTTAVRRALARAHRRVAPRDVGPRRGSTYYGKCGSRWALASFRNPATGYTDQPEVFRRRAGGEWRDLGDTGGGCGPVPRALTALWGLDCV